jgi:hypothetical protein
MPVALIDLSLVLKRRSFCDGVSFDLLSRLASAKRLVD